MTFLIIFVLLIVLIFVFVWFVGDLFFKFSLDTKSRFYLPAVMKKKGISDADAANNKKRKEMDDWIINNSKEVHITSSDNLDLCAYFMESEKSHLYMILCHGYEGSPAEMLGAGMNFKEKGYNLLFINQRCYGKSQGRYCTMGVKEADDIKKWTEYLVLKDNEAKIGLQGLSMGSGAIMNALSLNLPVNVKFAVEDCGFSSLWDIFSYQLKNLFHLPVFPFLYMASFAARRRVHISYHQGNCKKSVAESKIPVLFIHGTEDEVVPFFMEKELFDAAAEPKELLVVEGAKHTKACKTNPQLYFSTLNNFADKYNN